MKIEGETSGLLEALFSAGTFWIPNILALVFDLSRTFIFFILAYDFAVMFILLSTIMHLKFSKKSMQTLK